MIRGIGVDTVEICRIREYMEKKGPEGAFFRRAFTPAEQAEAAGRGDPAAYYATRFAAKEAVFKALAHLTQSGSFDLRITETLTGEGGCPRIHVGDELQAVLEETGTTALHLSLTTEAGLATAFVVAEG